MIYDQGDESQSNCNAIQDEHCEYVNIHAEEELASVGELYSKAAGTISNGNSEGEQAGLFTFIRLGNETMLGYKKKFSLQVRRNVVSL